MKVSARGRRLKGSQFERAIAAYLRDHGIPAKRVDLSGGGSTKGDVLFSVGCLDERVLLSGTLDELKEHSDYCGWKQKMEAKWLADGFRFLYKNIKRNYALCLRRDLPAGKKAPADMGALVVLRLEDFAELVKR